MDDCFSETGVTFAIVSPCSKCQNQLSAAGPDGKPACPRRKWQADLAAMQTAANGNTDPTIVPLALYGTEGTPQAGSNSLVNPVYWNSNKSSLVWIAGIRDNSGITDVNNNTVAPSILDPSFIPNYTQWIKCRPLPYIPAQHEAAARTSGALKEGDQVIACLSQNQQNYSSTDVDGNTTHEYQQVNIEGFIVAKTDLVYNAPRSTVNLDYNVQGT